VHKIEPNTSTPSINFKNFANSYKDVDPSSLNQGWVAYAQSIGNTDKELLKFLSDVDNNKRQISDIDTYIQSATQSTSQFATSLKNIAVNAGSILLINLAIQAGMLAWDHLNVTVEEQESKVNSLQAAYQNLQSEYEQLSSKQNLTDAEQKRLSYLERRLELDERILKAEKHQLFKEKTGQKFTDRFDSDNYYTKYQQDTSRIPAGINGASSAASPRNT
jgi:predicted RNase H-like nuclease (RuvC/YqgF family)